MAKVDRAVLEQDGVRKAVRDAGHGHLLLSDKDVAHSLEQTLAEHRKGEPVWVFGYGSLIWNPLMEFAERRRAQVRGYHRGFYIWSKINRGTPEVPGLVLALDSGGSCQGVAYRMRDDKCESELAILWRREMLAGTYMPKWISADIGGETVRAIAFVVNRAKPGYAGRLDDAQIVAIARRAHGAYGSCAEYLIQTATSLETQGIPDARLSRLARLLGDSAQPE
ncbi:MAG TPA: gamma-glutamylcyclotransferase [Burkholderiales bacterium]